jgi:hypothetical protein
MAEVREISCMAWSNYRRGVLRLYLVLSTAWIGWGLYRPVVLSHETANIYFQDASKELEECKADATKRFNEMNDECTDYLRNGGAPYPGCEMDPTKRDSYSALPRDLDLCTKLYEGSMNLPNAMERRTIFDIYRVFGYKKLAIFCLGPPVAVFVILLAFAWIVAGFNTTAKAH